MHVEYQLNGEASIAELMSLLAETSWAGARDPKGIAEMLKHTHLWVIARVGGQLVGFGRAIGDGVYRALIEDVIVAERFRLHGIGSALLERLLGELSPCEKIQLDCEPTLRPFYEKAGFREDRQPKMVLVR